MNKPHKFLSVYIYLCFMFDIKQKYVKLIKLKLKFKNRGYTSILF